MVKETLNYQILQLKTEIENNSNSKIKKNEMERLL